MPKFQNLIDAIRLTHGVEARHIETVPVLEIFMAGFAWEGNVEVFEVIHPSGANRCYAWTAPVENDPTYVRVVCVIGVGKLKSPTDAVRAAISGEKEALLSQPTKVSG